MRFTMPLKAVCIAVFGMVTSGLLLPSPFSFILILALAGPCSAGLMLLRAERQERNC